MEGLRFGGASAGSGPSIGPFPSARNPKSAEPLTERERMSWSEISAGQKGGLAWHFLRSLSLMTIQNQWREPDLLWVVLP